MLYGVLCMLSSVSPTVYVVRKYNTIQYNAMQWCPEVAWKH